MDKQDLIFASIVGSGKVGTYERLKMIENKHQKTTGTSLGLIPFQEKEDKVQAPNYKLINDAWTESPVIGKDLQYAPLSFSIDDGNSWFHLPYEPLISTNGKNKVIRRSVAKWNADVSEKQTGSIKERWSQDDTEITITGILMGQIMQGKFEDCYPKADFIKLYEIMTTSKEIKVLCPLLELQGINKIVIEDYSFPFTKGENVQAFEIKAYSDFSYNLLIEI